MQGAFTAGESAMAFGDNEISDQTALALSGGGFRATLFHIGALRRLVEIGALTHIDRISSVSGGSIIAGVLAHVWPALAADPSIATYNRLVADPLRAFCRLNIDVAAVAEGAVLPFETAADLLERQYRIHLFDVSLDTLPDAPVFVFNSTNMATGRSFRFTKKYMADYKLGLVRAPTLPLARAVAASSAFPPVFSPVVIKNPGTFEMVEGAVLNGDPDYTRKLYLADGGVYDNLGLETVWNRCKTVLVSDAGAPFAVGPTIHQDWVRQTTRALDVATDQSRSMRKRELIADYQAKVRAGCYWGIDTNITDYVATGILPTHSAITAPLAKIRTRLNAFTDTEQGQLINWGYALTDAAVRSYAPQLVRTSIAPAWPCPETPLG
jgi:NTE family protein